MNSQSFDAVSNGGSSRRSRRASLIGLGGALVAAAVTPPSPALAGKVSKRVKKKCKKQIGKCDTSVASFCANTSSPEDLEACEAALLPCCSSFKGCNAGSAYDCLIDGLQTLSAPGPS